MPASTAIFKIKITNSNRAGLFQFYQDQKTLDNNPNLKISIALKDKNNWSYGVRRPILDQLINNYNVGIMNDVIRKTFYLKIIKKFDERF